VARSEQFSVEINPDRNRVVVSVHGELDMATVPRVRESIEELRRDNCRSILLDLCDVAFMDAQGLQLLLALQRSAQGGAWEFALRDGSPPVARILEVTGLSEHFQRG